MKKVKVKNLEMFEYAVKKPVTIAADGKKSTLADVAQNPSLSMANLFSMEDKLQIELTVERYIPEPDFRLGIFEHGSMSKEEVIDSVKNQTLIGQDIVRAEMVYCQELMQNLNNPEPIPAKPKIPDIEPEPIPPYYHWIPKDWWQRWTFLRNTALFCENTTDDVTQKATPYRFKHVHPAFTKRGFNVVVLKDINDDRFQFVDALKKNRVTYISGIGHGSPTTFTGHLGSPILKVGSYNPEEVKGKTIHLLSCQTAKQLGPDLIRNGAKAYAGYYENFTFIYDQPATPFDDMELFWQCDSTYDIMLAGGATVQEAHEATIRTYNACIAKPGVAGTATATWLTHDRNYFMTPVIDGKYGSKSTKLYPYVAIRVPRLESAEELFAAPESELEFEPSEVEPAN